MGRLPLPARMLILAIWLLGVGSLLAVRLVPAPPTRADSWELALFILLGLLAGRTKVRLMPRRTAEDIGSLSLSFALIFAALLRLGLAPAMLVGGLSTLASCLIPKRQALHQVTFNVCLSAFATFASGWVFLSLNAGGVEIERLRSFGAVMSSGMVFFLINSSAVAGVIALCTGKSLPTVWHASFLWTAPSYFAAAAAGTLAVVVLGAHAGTVLLFVTPVAYLTYATYTLYARRAEEKEHHIEVLEESRARLTADLEHEHRIAETLQRSLLPAVPRNAFPGLTLEMQYEPAWDEALIGGDFYDALPLKDGKVALVVGDVCGKGLAAATHTAEVKFALRAYLHEHSDPAAALDHLNQFLLSGQQAAGGVRRQTLVAVCLAVVDTVTGEIQVGAAGSEYPLLLRRDRSEPETIQPEGILLGVDPEAHYRTVPLCLNSGDTLLMVTDCVTEARAGNAFFGADGLARIAHRAFITSASSEDLGGGAIIREAKAFAGGTLQDDACLLLARRR